MLCPSDKTFLLKNDSGKPLYQCSDCSGVFVSMSVASSDLAQILDAPASTFRCPRDGSQMHASETAGVAIHLCEKCGSAWLGGDAQDRLLSKTPDWFGHQRPATAGSVAAGMAVEAIFVIIGS